jgi:hypothetical protein
MRAPQPHDGDGRPCLATHPPRSQPPLCTSPTPTHSGQPKRRTCSPTSPRSVTASTHGSASPAGRDPGHGRRRGPDRRPIDHRDRGGAADPQPVRAALGTRRDAPDRWAVPAAATIRRTLARVDADAWPLPSAGGSLTVTVPASVEVGSRSTARRCQARPARAAGSICLPRWSTPPGPCSPNARSRRSW